MNQPIKLTYTSPDDPKLKTVFIQSVERLTGQRKLESLYHAALAQKDDIASFWNIALAQLRITLDYDEALCSVFPMAARWSL